METFDGNHSLTETESCVRQVEAGGEELNELRAGASNPPTNEAEFEELPPGELPAKFHLTTGAIPAGKQEVWSGTIFVQGTRTQARAYRE